MEPVVIPQPATSTLPTFPGVSLQADSPLSDLFGQGIAGWSSLAGILAFLSILWSIFAILAYLFSVLLLVLYVYASVRKNMYSDLLTQQLRDAERLYDEQYRGVARSNRLQDVYTHADSENPNDWKLAIIEADVILDTLLKDRGYPGASLGERLRSISPDQLSTLQDAWEAHKIRNRIAHDGADFVLTKRVAHETIARYQRVFTEFGIS
jgi:hypothetical protein